MTLILIKVDEVGVPLPACAAAGSPGPPDVVRARMRASPRRRRRRVGSLPRRSRRPSYGLIMLNRLSRLSGRCAGGTDAGQTARGPRPACEPDLVLVNGRIYTVDSFRPWAEALAICGERIARSGRSAEVSRARHRPGAQAHRFHGRLVVPGFNDASRPSRRPAPRARRHGPAVRRRTPPSLPRACKAMSRRIPKGRWIRRRLLGSRGLAGQGFRRARTSTR